MLTILSIIIALGIVLGLKDFFRPHNKKYSRKNKWNPPVREQLNQRSSSYLDISDPRDQLKIVSDEKIAFSAQKIMGRKEYRVFNIIEKEVIKEFKYYRVFAQVSLGEVLSSETSYAYSCINTKRVDVLIIDGAGNPILAVEYQGEGHYQSSAALRDAIKKEALRKAGVGYIEITPDHTNDDIKYIVRRAIESKMTNNKVIEIPVAEQSIHVVK
ncbi:DUF2726 domain-containing protein [Entomomonas sp. E2T0]|uniref:DUF2726 domain-containing protein n=1 Tax=Entomomonas sp. E2T0 TaxID=2930213 RepID=UPI0022284C07|nr:DUF2726 domain-containing protein [Entomomonas sp. E2T0]UYZ85311.1 DUF2726 domain-containing protein [Entomomonas sp. E2T0]